MASVNSSEIDLQLQHCLSGSGTGAPHVDVEDRSVALFVPHTKRTVCYIVGGLLINDSKEVLMMQEAKESCRGKWYLPAGRLEVNETLQEGAKREVLEETGLEFKPETLLSVESQSGTWYRFIFTGNVTGGRLKTLKEKDEESLQAKWCSLENIRRELPLRGNDILYLIELGQKYHRLKVVDRPPPCMPIIESHQKCLLRIFLVSVPQNDSDCEKVLVCERDSLHLPVVVLHGRTDNLKHAMFRCLKAALRYGKSTPPIKVCGLLSVEHSGDIEAVNDGICITVLCQMEAAPKTLRDYQWYSIENCKLKIHLKDKMKEGQTIPLKLY